MSPTQVTPENASPSVQVGLVPRPRVIVAANSNDVMRDQLELLIEHAQDGVCGCEQCQRYLRARSLLLMELFPESSPVVATTKSSSSSGR
jgi:hypothetical protein